LIRRLLHQHQSHVPGCSGERRDWLRVPSSSRSLRNNEDGLSLNTNRKVEEEREEEEEEGGGGEGGEGGRGPREAFCWVFNIFPRAERWF